MFSGQREQLSVLSSMPSEGLVCRTQHTRLQVQREISKFGTPHQMQIESRLVRQAIPSHATHLNNSVQTYSRNIDRGRDKLC